MVAVRDSGLSAPPPRLADKVSSTVSPKGLIGKLVSLIVFFLLSSLLVVLTVALVKVSFVCSNVIKRRLTLPDLLVSLLPPLLVPLLLLGVRVARFFGSPSFILGRANGTPNVLKALVSKGRGEQRAWINMAKDKWK
jgi:hypothetical protein